MRNRKISYEGSQTLQEDFPERRHSFRDTGGKLLVHERRVSYSANAEGPKSEGKVFFERETACQGRHAEAARNDTGG